MIANVYFYLGPATFIISCFLTRRSDLQHLPLAEVTNGNRIVDVTRSLFATVAVRPALRGIYYIATLAND